MTLVLSKPILKAIVKIVMPIDTLFMTDINKLIVLNLYFDLHVCTRECHNKIQRAEARMNILPANLEKLSNDQLSKDMQRSI